MSKQTINVGSAANDGTGDTLRLAAQKINSNFTEVYDKANNALLDTESTGISLISTNWAQLQYDPTGIYNKSEIQNGNWLYVDSSGLHFDSNVTGTYETTTINNYGNILSGNGQINFVKNSSSDGYGYSTIQIIPEGSVSVNDQYLVIDPTYTNHIHIRAGGTIDDSAATLFLGGESSHVRVDYGLNPPIVITSNNNSWSFNQTGGLVFPDSTTQTTAASPYKEVTTIIFPGNTYLTLAAEAVFCDVNAAGANINVVLPDPTVLGKVITVKNINTGANVVYVQAVGGQAMELLSGAVGTGLYETLSITGQSVTWLWDNSCWRIISAYTPA